MQSSAPQPVSTPQRAEGDPKVKVVLLEGEGDKAFCAGGDIRGRYGAVRGMHMVQ